MTPLDKPLRRELMLGDQAYTLTIDPTGLKLVEKGRRNGVESAAQTRSPCALSMTSGRSLPVARSRKRIV